ncbi:hypothetical protein BDW59DRAFT_166434 [Aspergillus cavernicola]|uniref:Rootletin n=1 Tax=Aspergillus cavernicola TaxID=176166 RepID=A0ABR4HNE2_9EURO
MENNGASASSTGDAFPGSELDGDGYDTNEELVLLQIMEANNEAVSPSLQAVMDDRADIQWPSGQRPQSPLLMERPQSSGIDTTAFSFAKPAQSGKPFSLQLTTRPSSSAAISQGKPGANRRVTERSDQEQKEQEKSIACSRTRSAEFPARSHNVESFSSSTEQRLGSNVQSSLSTSPKNGTKPGTESAVDCEIRQVRPPDTSSEFIQQHLLSQYDMQGAESLNLSHYNQPPNQSSMGDIRHNGAPSFEHLIQKGNGLTEIRSPKDQLKIVKRRQSDKRRATKRVSYAPSDDRSSHVPEEVLFQQLISRMKAREESEAVASHLQKEMEANVSHLQEENKSLKDELEILSSKLCQRTNEVRSYKSQTDSWKSKLAKVKHFLNELGADYQNLRGEAIQFKATRKSLDKERKEIAENIEALNARLLQISQTSRDRRGCLSESESLIISLRQELKHARERTQYSQDQLADEKKRSHLLELYIQNCSRAQDRKLDLVKTGQLDMLKKLEFAFHATTKQCESSHTVINDVFERKVEELLTLLRSTAESLSNDKMDVQHCRETICTFESRMDLTTRRLADDIENNSKTTQGAMTGLEEQLQVFKDSVSDGSALLNQLSASEDRCKILHKKLEETVPAFDTIGRSIDSLQKREVDLGNQMENLESSLIEVKLPERFAEDYFHISEKLGLDNELQQLSLKLKLTEDRLQIQQLDSTQKNNELLGMTARAHQAELKATKLESHTADLQEKVKTTESKAQEDLEIAVAGSRDQCKAEFERQFHQLLEAKTEAQVDTQRLKEQLAEAQRKMTEAEDSAQMQRSDLQTLLTERQKRINDLETIRAQQTSNLSKQEGKIEKLREHEAAIMAQQASMQILLDEANTRSAGVEGELLKTATDNQHSLQVFQALQNSFSSLQAEVAKKEAVHQGLSKELGDANSVLSTLQSELASKETDYQALSKELEDASSAFSTMQSENLRKEADHQGLSQKLEDANSALFTLQSELVEKKADHQMLSKELEHANSARTSLETSKAKAKAEIHALLKRVQDSELYTKRVKEILDRKGIAQLELSLPESLDQLEATLQLPKSGHPVPVEQTMAQVRTPETSARDGSSGAKHATKNLDETIVEPKTPVNRAVEPSPSKHTGIIVPFSSISHGVSPARCPNTENESFDLSYILAETPEKESSPDELSAQAGPEKDNLSADIATRRRVEEADDPTGLHHCANVQRTTSGCTQARPSIAVEQDPFQSRGRKVSFVTRKLTAEADNLQVPDSQEKNDQTNTLETSLGGDNPTRINRWTYSKRKWETSTKQQDTVSSQKITSQTEGQQAHAEPGKNKKAMIASASTLVCQTRTASELYDRRRSPTRLASGSSRTPSSNVPIPSQTVSTRSSRRSGRKTRGDKYNARFSQGV